jgi:WhiB family redox-sensing transcriptional regulator
MNTDEWRDSARCKGHADLFLAGDDSWQKANAHLMKKICEQCPVRIPCLDYALSNNITYLVWGGLAANARAKVRSARLRSGRSAPARDASTGLFRPSIAPASEDVQASSL